MANVYDLIDQLDQSSSLDPNGIRDILASKDEDHTAYLREKARKKTDQIYQRSVFVRGLIEYTNTCIRDCSYCGIRRNNANVDKFALDKEEILGQIQKGHALGFRTFVIQGGEDPAFSDKVFEDIIYEAKSKYNDIRITLSLGLRSRASLHRLKKAGADRYLVRFETIDEDHFSYLHPDGQRLADRTNMLEDLKDLGYHVGTGNMVGSPGQTIDHLVKDLKYIKELNPDMVGLGPFIPHKDSIFKDHPSGDLTTTLKVLSLVRLLVPHATIPATTALNSLVEEGRILGLDHGANVLMPNLSPEDKKGKYDLYNNKKTQNLEGGQGLEDLDLHLRNWGYHIDYSTGDPISKTRRLK